MPTKWQSTISHCQWNKGSHYTAGDLNIEENVTKSRQVVESTGAPIQSLNTPVLLQPHRHAPVWFTVKICECLSELRPCAFKCGVGAIQQKFTQWGVFSLGSFVRWYRLLLLLATSVSEEFSASIFRIIQKTSTITTIFFIHQRLILSSINHYF